MGISARVYSFACSLEHDLFLFVAFVKCQEFLFNIIAILLMLSQLNWLNALTWPFMKTFHLVQTSSFYIFHFE